MKVILVATNFESDQKHIYDILCSHDVYDIRTTRRTYFTATIVTKFVTYAQLTDVMCDIRNACSEGCYIKKIIEPRRPFRLRLARLFRRKK